MVQPKLSSRPAPFATGSLAQRPLAHLLVYVLDRELTGSFELSTREGAHVQIVVEGGKVARVATSEPVAYLGHVLYESGAIDAEQLSQSLAVVAATQRLHGQVLIARGMIDAEGLGEGLRIQRARKLHHAFELSPETAFAFYPGIDLVGYRAGDVEPMDPLPSIWRGVLLHPAYDHVRSTLATAGERRLRLVGAIDRLGLEEKELETVRLLRVNPAVAAELSYLAGLEPRRAELLAYFLIIAKMVELVRGVDASAPSPTSGSSARLNSHPAPLSSGEYARGLSFAMRAVRPDGGPLRIPSPMPFASNAPRPLSATVATGPPLPLRREAEQSLSQAEMHLVLGEREQAIANARRALACDQGMPEATALLAYLEVLGLDGEQRQLLQESLDLLNASLRKRAACKRAYFYRAEIRKRLGDHAGAIDDLRLAVAQDPHDVDARRELRVYEQKVQEGSIKLGTPTSETHRTASGLMSRLRGKKA